MMSTAFIIEGEFMAFKKEIVIPIAGIVLAIAGMTAAGVALSKMIGREPVQSAAVTTYTPRKQEAPSMTDGEKKLQLKKDMDIILVMGIDEAEHIGEADTYVNYSQADVLYVYAIDHKNKTYQALQINRETMTNVQSYTVDGEKFTNNQKQICLAHSYGKNDKERCLNQVDAVSGLIFDIPIAHYVSLDMGAIPVLNDKVGGVTVTIPAGMEKVDPAFVEGTRVRLQGKQTELFVRSRTVLSDDTNIFRMQRQEIFLKAWKEQAKAKMSTDSDLAVNMLLALSNYMYSDMSVNTLSELANKLKDYKDLGTLTTTGETVEEGEGHVFREFHVDMDDLQKKVIELFYEETPVS